MQLSCLALISILNPLAIATAYRYNDKFTYYFYNYKGEAAQIRSFLDEDTKKDLRAGHFKLGSHNNEYSTTAGRNH